MSLHSLSCKSPFKYFGNTLQIMRIFWCVWIVEVGDMTIGVEILMRVKLQVLQMKP